MSTIILFKITNKCTPRETTLASCGCVAVGVVFLKGGRKEKG
jgi:hypothetical protein